MQSPIPDAQQYGNDLDSFLLQLKNELNIQGKSVITPVDSQNSLDEYLLQLNTFYYESFHRKFFPLYNQTIKEDIRSLLHISHQEEVLKKDIIANLKQHARLFNQVKNITALLQHKRKEIQAVWLENQRGSEERNVSLLFITKELANGCNSIHTVLRNLQILLEDNKLLAALNQHPSHAVVSLLIADWEPDNSKAARDFNRLLAAWQLAVKLLVKFAENSAPSLESLELLKDELHKIDTAWDNRKIPDPIRTWYQQYIQRSFRLYRDSLSSGTEKRNHRHTAQTAGQFAEWLNALLTVVEQSMAFKSRCGINLINQLSMLTRIDKGYVKEMDLYIARVLPAIEELVLSLSSSSQANYQYHSERIGGLLSVINQYLQQQIDSNLNSRAKLVAFEISQLHHLLILLESRLELLNEKEEHSVYTNAQYQAIIDSLDSYLKLLEDSREELNRMLAPRYLKNSFQGLELSVEHVTVAAGSLFPPQYHYLIDEMAINTREADAPAGLILYEEGDIFIIRLDELTETEIPKIIIAKKG